MLRGCVPGAYLCICADYLRGDNMFRIGDKIVYGSTGVCMVEDITTVNLRGVDKNRLYYILKPLYQDGIIRTPVDNDKVFKRPVITRQEAEALVDMIPTVKASAYNEKNLAQLRSHYQEYLGSFDCADLIELAMSIYAKKQDAVRQQKKFGITDERYLKRAEEMLFGELAVALEISREEVPNYITQRLKK